MFILTFAVIGLSVFIYISGMKTTLLFLSVFLSASLFGQNVYIPDDNFKANLVGNSAINTNGDDEIQVSEASAFDGAINCSSQGISDMTGIEAFSALTELYCVNNPLTSLDLSQNIALEILWCLNQLTSLDVSQNTALTNLFCENNQLTSLDVSQNTALLWLSCSDNQLTSLDVSQNNALGGLSCGANQLICLNIANGNNFFFSIADCYLANNPNLTCIEVDDAEWSADNWSTYVDSWASFSEDCNNDCTSSLTELTSSKNLIQILDMMGRETSFKPNTPLIYVYDDGSIEKVFSVDY